MSSLEHVRTEDMAAVISLAAQMQDDDQAKEAQRQAAITTATEIKVPQVYLERAAEAHLKRLALTKRQRRRRSFLGAFLALATLGSAGIGWWYEHPPRPKPYLNGFSGTPAEYWLIRHNRESSVDGFFTAQADPQHTPHTVAVVGVDHFRAASDGSYSAEIVSSVPLPSLSRYQDISFYLRGGLPHTRLCLENEDERWLSPLITVPDDWDLAHTPIDRFQRETRAPGQSAWHPAEYLTPDHIDKIAFLAGQEANPISARGDLVVTDLRIQ